MTVAENTTPFIDEAVKAYWTGPGCDGEKKRESWLGAGTYARSLRALARRIADAYCPIVIEGETGTGKEVLARYLHALSLRAKAPFVKVNCAGLSPEYAGALLGHSGVFQAAGRGAVMLDEIGDLDLKLQAMLLGVLDDSRQTTAGARVIAATQRDLEKAVAEGSFRRDLFYRLNIIYVRIPPLRDRREDILPLAEYLFRKHCPGTGPPPLTFDLREQLLAYNWPGNVRELENIMWRLAVCGDVRLPAPAGGVPPRTLPQLFGETEQAEVRAILAALNKTWWNRRKAAALLNLDYRTLLYRMKKHGIQAVGKTA